MEIPDGGLSCGCATDCGPSMPRWRLPCESSEGTWYRGWQLPLRSMNSPTDHRCYLFAVTCVTNFQDFAIERMPVRATGRSFEPTDNLYHDYRSPSTVVTITPSTSSISGILTPEPSITALPALRCVTEGKDKGGNVFADESVTTVTEQERGEWICEN